MKDYLETSDIDTTMLMKCIRKDTIGGLFVPVLLDTAFKNKGVQTLLDDVVNFMPSSLDAELSRVLTPIQAI